MASEAVTAGEPAPPERHVVAQRRLVRSYAVIALIPPVLLLLHLVLSAALSGGRVVENARTMWGVVVPYPILPIPAWFVIALAVVALLLVVPIVVITTPRRSGPLLPLFRFSLATLVADGFFAFAFPRTTGLVESLQGTTPGWHWIGAAIAGVCGVLLFIRIAMTSAEYTRLQRSGNL